MGKETKMLKKIFILFLCENIHEKVRKKLSTKKTNFRDVEQYPTGQLDRKKTFLIVHWLPVFLVCLRLNFPFKESFFT